MAACHYARARELVGCRFRLQGRLPEVGLDCVGVLLLSFDLPTDAAPRNYRLLHLSNEDRSSSFLKTHFERHRWEDADIGDALKLRLGRGRVHFAVFGIDRFVHAHAGLGRVVETPGWPEGESLEVWRLR